jgi:hypothetical protein
MRRRSDADDYLSLCHAGREEKSAGGGAKEFLHRAISLCTAKGWDAGSGTQVVVEVTFFSG